LASIALNKFVKPATTNSNTNSNEHCYDFEALHAVTKIVTYNLNRIIDINYYPTEKTKKSNLRHRPIGIGVQGLADVFMMMNCAFSSREAKELNKQIFETMYHAALESSVELAKLHGPYETFQGSPASKGVLQFDMWEYDPGNARYDWTALKASVVEYGLRNSLLLAPMPTASTSQILGNNEAFEPITSNIYTRRTLAGEFIVMNKYLMRELIDMGLWNERLKNNIIANRGSIQHLTQLSEHVRNKYKTVWEIQMKDVIDMSADRAVFICQSQSLNLWMEEPNYKSLTSMHFYAWSKGLKTGLYYLRRKPKHQAQQFTIEPHTAITSTNAENDDEKNSNLQFYQDEEVNTCTMCSS
jgi:ribonucleoside-diphosphate reductase alpha chain